MDLTQKIVHTHFGEFDDPGLCHAFTGMKPIENPDETALL